LPHFFGEFLFLEDSQDIGVWKYCGVCL